MTGDRWTDQYVTDKPGSDSTESIRLVLLYFLVVSHDLGRNGGIERNEDFKDFTINTYHM